MLWVDKYKPKILNELNVHSKLSKALEILAKTNDLPHILFYGPSGAGKNTLINAFLKEIFGDGVSKVKLENKELKIKDKIIEFSMLSSIYHIQMNPSASGTNDKKIIQETLKEIASTRSLNSDKKPFKIVVIDEVENLSKTAQHSLRRTMEKYTECCRLILCCEAINKLIDPLVSRCLCLRIPSPENEQMCQVLQSIAEKESLDLSPEIVVQIAKSAEGNLRRAILSLETFFFCDLVSQGMRVQKLDWEQFIKEVCILIREEQTPARLLVVRSKLYELLNHLIPANTILKEMTKNFLEKCDFDLQKKVIFWAAFHESRMKQGTKPIYHLEAFVAKFMDLYQKWGLGFFDQ